MRLAVTMFILGVGTSPGGRAWAGKSNTMNAGAGGGRPLTSPAPGSVGRRSTISYDQAKTSSSSTERTNDTPRYSDNQLFNSFFCCCLFSLRILMKPSFDSIETAMKLAQLNTPYYLFSFNDACRHWETLRNQTVFFPFLSNLFLYLFHFSVIRFTSIPIVSSMKQRFV